MHLCFVPITAKGRLSSKDVIGGPQGLVKWQDRFYEHMRQRYPDLSRGLPKKLTHRKHVPPYMFKLTAELYQHYDEICQAINSIGVLNSGRKKEEAIALLGRYAPEMTQLKAQVASTDKQIADLERELAYVTEGRATAWRANQDYKQELEEANYKLYQLNREQKKLEGIISQIPPELLAQLTKTERDGRKIRKEGKIDEHSRNQGVGVRRLSGQPFQVRDDEGMELLVQSIKEFGVMTPVVVRPVKEGGYEIVSGPPQDTRLQEGGD